MKLRERGLSAALFCSLKQDGQDEQDEQDEEAKVWKTLMSIDLGATSRKGP